MALTFEDVYLFHLGVQRAGGVLDALIRLVRPANLPSRKLLPGEERKRVLCGVEICHPIFFSLLFDFSYKQRRRNFFSEQCMPKKIQTAEKSRPHSMDPIPRENQACDKDRIEELATCCSPMVRGSNKCPDETLCPLCLQRIDGDEKVAPRCVCPCPKTIENGTIDITQGNVHSGYDTSGKVTCNDGYTLLGSEKVECKKSQWQNPPTCEKDAPPPPPKKTCSTVLQDGQITVAGDGDSATYKCDTGYKPAAETSLTCESGSWQPAPLCSLAVPPQNTCSTVLQHGQITVAGDSATYKCDTDYKAGSKSTNLACENGQWRPAPTCTLQKPAAQSGFPVAIVIGGSLALAVVFGLIFYIRSRSASAAAGGASAASSAPPLPLSPGP